MTICNRELTLLLNLGGKVGDDVREGADAPEAVVPLKGVTAHTVLAGHSWSPAVTQAAEAGMTLVLSWCSCSSCGGGGAGHQGSPRTVDVGEPSPASATVGES